MVAAIAGAGRGRVWREETAVEHARSQDPPREDWTTGAGERFFRSRAHQGGIAEGKSTIERRQCQSLELSRAPAHYQVTPVSAIQLTLMRRIDKPHLDHLLAAGPSGDQAPESRVGGGHYLHSDEARLHIPVCGAGLGESGGCWRGSCPTRWPPTFAGRDHPVWHTGHPQH